MTYTSLDQLPIMLSVEHLAAALGIGRNTAYDLVRSGQIQSTRIGHQIRICKSALQAYIGA